MHQPQPNTSDSLVVNFTDEQRDQSEKQSLLDDQNNNNRSDNNNNRDTHTVEIEEISNSDTLDSEFVKEMEAKADQFTFLNALSIPFRVVGAGIVAVYLKNKLGEPFDPTSFDVFKDENFWIDNAIMTGAGNFIVFIPTAILLSMYNEYRKYKKEDFTPEQINSLPSKAKAAIRSSFTEFLKFEGKFAVDGTVAFFLNPVAGITINLAMEMLLKKMISETAAKLTAGAISPILSAALIGYIFHDLAKAMNLSVPNILKTQISFVFAGFSHELLAQVVADNWLKYLHFIDPKIVKEYAVVPVSTLFSAVPLAVDGVAKKVCGKENVENFYKQLPSLPGLVSKFTTLWSKDNNENQPMLEGVTVDSKYGSIQTSVNTNKPH